MRDFKVGDTVKVKSWGRNYSIYDDWFISHKGELKVEWIVRYAYGNKQFSKYQTSDSDNNTYKILYLSEEYALITPASGWESPVYLVGTDGLKFSNTYTLTMSEAIRKLEDLCGGPVEIVGGDEQ